MTNKFSIGEKVVVTGKSNIGTIEQIKETKYIYKDNRTHSSYEYLVQVGQNTYKDWYTESRLSVYLKLDDEIAVNKILIDANLMHDLEIVKRLKQENDQLEAQINEAN